jgi:hypothetical protein
MCDLQLDYICTYKDITEEGEDEIGLKQMCYQLQLLQAFNMIEFNDKEIEDNITKLYTQLKEVSFVQELILKNPYSYQLVDPDLVFRTLFSYDYFDLFHKCLVYYYNNKPVDTPLVLLLKEFNTVNK